MTPPFGGATARLATGAPATFAPVDHASRTLPAPAGGGRCGSPPDRGPARRARHGPNVGDVGDGEVPGRRPAAGSSGSAALGDDPWWEVIGVVAGHSSAKGRGLGDSNRGIPKRAGRSVGSDKRSSVNFGARVSVQRPRMRRRMASKRPPGTYSPSARTGRSGGGAGGVAGMVRRAGPDALPTVPVDSWAASIRRWSRPDTAFRFRGCFDIGNPLQHNPGLADPDRPGAPTDPGFSIGQRPGGRRARASHTPRIGTRAPNLHTISRIFSPLPANQRSWGSHPRVRGDPRVR